MFYVLHCICGYSAAGFSDRLFQRLYNSMISRTYIAAFQSLWSTLLRLTHDDEAVWGHHLLGPPSQFRTSDTTEMEPGLWVMGHRITGSAILAGSGWVTGHSVSDPVFDPVLIFNMRVYIVALFLQSKTISTNHECLNDVKSRNVVMVTSQETETADTNPQFRFLVTSRHFWVWRHLSYYCFLSRYCFNTLTDRVGSGLGSTILTRFHFWNTNRVLELRVFSVS